MKAKQWTVEPFLTPEADDDPLGVYKVQPIFDNLTAKFEATNDFDLDTPEGQAEEEKVLNAIHKENAKVAHLIAAAPDLLAALRAIVARINGVWDDPDLLAFGELLPDTEADIEAIASQAIAKARGGE